jgi:hypothetical protein
MTQPTFAAKGGWLVGRGLGGMMDMELLWMIWTWPVAKGQEYSCFLLSAPCSLALLLLMILINALLPTLQHSMDIIILKNQEEGAVVLPAVAVAVAVLPAVAVAVTSKY